MPKEMALSNKRTIESVKGVQIEQGQKIAVLESLAKEMNSHMERVEGKLDKQYEAYMLTQGTLSSVIDLKNLMKEKDDDFERRVRSLEKFMDTLKGKMTTWLAIGPLVGTAIGGIITAVITANL